MAHADAKHETVLDAPVRLSRLARVYAEALLGAALQESPEAAEGVGDELADFVRAASENRDVSAFIANPTIGKKAKAAALDPALKEGASNLLRGIVGVLAMNNRLDLLTQVAVAYRGLINERAGRVPVRVTAAVELTDDQRKELTANIQKLLSDQEPVLDVRVDPELLGGMIVQVGDSVIDTSVRSRLQSMRALLLERGTYGD